MPLFKRRRPAAAAGPGSDYATWTAADALQVVQTRGQNMNFAIGLLGREGDEAAVGPLLDVLAWRTPLALEAAKGLGELGKRGVAVPPELLLATLARIGWGTGSNLPGVDTSIARAGVSLLRVHATGAHVPVLGAWLVDPATNAVLRQLALDVLPYVNDGAAVRALADAERRARVDTGPLDHDKVLDALGRAVHPASVDALLALFAEGAPGNRKLVNPLAASRDPRALAAVASTLDGDQHAHSLLAFGEAGLAATLAAVAAPDGTIRGKVVSSLSGVRHPAAADRLLQLLDEHGWTGPGTGTPIQVLGALRERRAVPALLRLLDPPTTQPPLRDVVRALGLIGDPAAVEPLLRLLAAPGHPDELITVLVATLGRLGDGRAVDGLARLFEQRGPFGPPGEDEVIDALAAIGDPRAVDAVLHILQRYPRGPAIRALAEMGDQRAVPALVALLDATDPGSSSVQTLVDALVALDDPRALTVLRAVDPGPVSDQRLHATRDNDGAYTMLEARKKLHDPIAAFEQRTASGANRLPRPPRPRQNRDDWADQNARRALEGVRKRLDPDLQVWAWPRGPQRLALQPEVGADRQVGVVENWTGQPRLAEDPARNTPGFTWRYGASRLELTVNQYGSAELTANGRAAPPTMRGLSTLLGPAPTDTTTAWAAPAPAPPQSALPTTPTAITPIAPASPPAARPTAPAAPPTAPSTTPLTPPTTTIQSPTPSLPPNAPPTLPPVTPPSTTARPPSTPPVVESAATAVRFLVTDVWDLASRDGLLVSGKTLSGKIRSGLILRDDAGHSAEVLGLEFLSPRDIATGQVTIMVARTEPSPVRRQVVLTAS